jgi:hypothetical protein
MVEVTTAGPVQLSVPLLTVAAVGALVNAVPGVTIVIAPGTLDVTAIVAVAPLPPPPVKARAQVPVPVAETPLT